MHWNFSNMLIVNKSSSKDTGLKQFRCHVDDISNSYFFRIVCYDVSIYELLFHGTDINSETFEFNKIWNMKMIFTVNVYQIKIAHAMKMVPNYNR